MHPARDESLVGRVSTQRVFPERERAGDAEKRFGDDEADRGYVQAPEPAVARESQPEDEADPGGEKAADDEEDERRVDDEDRVGERGVAQSALASAGDFALSGTGTWNATVISAFFANSAGCAFTSGYG